MSTFTLQRGDWDGQPADLGDGWQLRKEGRSGLSHAVCRLWSHPLGYELRLEVDGSLIRSQVAKSDDEILTAQQEWRAAMVEKGVAMIATCGSLA
jgi:hypothetical protein